MLTPFLMAADGGDAVRDERASLEAMRSMLRQKISSLKREQDFLLFQKTMYAADSKYLIIDVKRPHGTAQVQKQGAEGHALHAFKKFPGRGLRQGMLVLTKKVEGKRGRDALVFGISLVVQWKQSVVPPQENGPSFHHALKKELLSVYYAVEEGAPAYILRCPAGRFPFRIFRLTQT